MSSDRREFLKTLSLGGLALFTTDWTRLVTEAKATSGLKVLPPLPGETVSPALRPGGSANFSANKKDDLGGGRL